MAITLGDLLHGDETRVWGDSAYSGQRDVIAEHAPRAKDVTNKKGARNRPLSAEDRSKNRTKSKVRAKGEHPFLILKRIFGFNKVRYRGLDKNANRLFVACGLRICTWRADNYCDQHRTGASRIHR